MAASCWRQAPHAETSSVLGRTMTVSGPAAVAVTFQLCSLEDRGLSASESGSATAHDVPRCVGLCTPHQPPPLALCPPMRVQRRSASQRTHGRTSGGTTDAARRWETPPPTCGWACAWTGSTRWWAALAAHPTVSLQLAFGILDLLPCSCLLAAALVPLGVPVRSLKPWPVATRHTTLAWACFFPAAAGPPRRCEPKLAVRSGGGRLWRTAYHRVRRVRSGEPPAAACRGLGHAFRRQLAGWQGGWVVCLLCTEQGLGGTNPPAAAAGSWLPSSFASSPAAVSWWDAPGSPQWSVLCGSPCHARGG